MQLNLRFWLALAILTRSVTAGQEPAVRVDFNTQIHPILAARCLPCHSSEKRSGGLSLATYTDALDGGRSGAAIRPGKPTDSLLMARISGETKPQMPLGGDPLPTQDLQLIRQWIGQGARPTPTAPPAQAKWEAPLFLSRPATPPVIWNTWDSTIDRFAAAYLIDKKTAQPVVVSDRLFCRRAYLDVWGLLPTPGELQSFLADRDPAKRRKLVESLLTNNRNYAENWISYWNDLLRNDEGISYFSETASRKSISPWLLNALETNLPYNQFVEQLLNPAKPSDPEGFLIGVNWRGTVSASQTPAMQAAQNTAQIFLGVNLKCNSCHDSFISRWKLRDAYAMATYFSADEKLELHRCDVAQHQYATPAFLYPALNRTPASISLADRRATAAAIFTDPRNGRLVRTVVNRIWLKLMGHGVVDNPDDMDGEPWSPALLDALSSDFVDHGYDLKFLIGSIVASNAYQMQSIARTSEVPRKYLFDGPEVRRMTAEEIADAIGAITGDWHTVQAGKKEAVYTRDWHVAATSYTRALGRPIRDQVFSTRETEATTLQALEVVNGETLTHWLLRGARAMTGQLPPEPVSIFDQPLRGKGGPYPFDIDITGVDRLWLLVQDNGSYSPEKLQAVWRNAEIVSASGAKPLTSLKPLDSTGLRVGADGLGVKTPSQVVYEISGQGYTHLRGSVALENPEITSDLGPNIRFFVFREQPNLERLTPVLPKKPLAEASIVKTPSAAVNRVFLYALGRMPSDQERTVAEMAVARPDGSVSPEDLADLLWAVLAKPEFQLIY